ncbi:MAG TPA: hypothetical protein VMT08_18150, partial [Bradyrhizobium sp.]|nr:hypothetical protein [Bradyrhizobium sp.]
MMPSRHRDKAAGRQTRDGVERRRANRYGKAGTPRPCQFRAYADKSDLHKEDATCPRNTTRRARKLNQSLAMIRDKGSSTLSLSLVDPKKVGNRTKTEEFSPMSVALDRSRTATIAKQPKNSASAEDESDVSALIARLTAEVNQVACEKTKSIQKITNQMKMLALNALIE